VRNNADNHNASRPNFAGKCPDHPQFSAVFPVSISNPQGSSTESRSPTETHPAKSLQKFQGDGCLRPHDFLSSPSHSVTPPAATSRSFPWHPRMRQAISPSPDFPNELERNDKSENAASDIDLEANSGRLGGGCILIAVQRTSAFAGV